MDIPKILVTADRVCDYIPFVSTVTNLVDLFQKYVTIPIACRTVTVQNRYFTHLNKKSFSQCIMLLIPGLNVLVSLHKHFKKQEKTQQKAEEIEKQALRDRLVKETIETKASNDILEKKLLQILAFIQNDPELKQKYNECYTRTTNILLPDPKLRRAPETNQSLVNEWTAEQHRQVYYEGWKTRFDDFMQKNPDFLELFTQKYDALINRSSQKKDFKGVD